MKIQVLCLYSTKTLCASFISFLVVNVNVLIKNKIIHKTFFCSLPKDNKISKKKSRDAVEKSS